ncbi:hypothetical protein CCMA1212_001741 [Trichoderma ghanense]|uniref:Uncharacterized protein n=1 Tax=Trichoderma ghanense TaxID=65468 RepID=A0ABY2HBU4_9HYPO
MPHAAMLGERLLAPGLFTTSSTSTFQGRPATASERMQVRQAVETRAKQPVNDPGPLKSRYRGDSATRQTPTRTGSRTTGDGLQRHQFVCM